jgi:hypothetical protein
MRTIANNNLSVAYVDANGILYIPTPPNDKKFTRYSSGIESYNNRTETPDFVDAIPYLTNKVFINLNTLII